MGQRAAPEFCKEGLGLVWNEEGRAFERFESL